jgi:hypothetical protein
MAQDHGAPAPKPDVLWVGDPSDDGSAARVLRMRDDRIETGELRAAKDGQPVVGELVKLSRRTEHERLFDVEVLARGPAPARADTAASRPALVNSDAYRAGWESIFGVGARDAPN